MNKLACLLLLPFALTQPLASAPQRSANPLRGQVVRPAASPSQWPLLAARWRGPAIARPSFIRALGRLLRAYTEPGRPEPWAGTSTDAPHRPVAWPCAGAELISPFSPQG